MKIKLLISTGLLILALGGCKNATSSKSNVSVEDLLGSWTFTYQLYTMTLTTNISTDIVDSWSMGTGALTISTSDDPLNYVHISLNQYGPFRINTDYSYIDIGNYPGIFLPDGGDIWRYDINSDLYIPGSYLYHSWPNETRNSESWYGTSPDFTFSVADFTLTVEDTLTKFDYETQTYDTAYVSGSVTAATRHLQANQSAEFTEDEYSLDNSHFLTFYDDSTYVEETLYPTRYIEEGTWYLENGILHLIYTWTDWEDEIHIDEYMYSVHLSQGHLTLETNGDACDDSDPTYPLLDCLSDIAWEFWPLEGTDIAAAMGRNYNELDRYEQPAMTGGTSSDSGIPLSQNRSYLRRETRIARQKLLPEPE